MESATLTELPTTTNTRAIIFTHFGGLQYGDTAAAWQAEKDNYLKRYTEILQHYLECARDGGQLERVYIYVDGAIRKVIPQVTKKSFTIQASDLAKEKALVELLEDAERIARRKLRLARDHAPAFQPVGLLQLIELFNILMDADHNLVYFLGGLRATLFTYDSPKFAEAAIRLARGGGPQMAANPVIRIDEDAVINAAFIRDLLEKYAELSAEAKLFFFSGTYGTNPYDPLKYDPINDHAVRVHWLADVPQHKKPVLTSKQKALAKIFLADLNELGATQIPDSKKHYSKALHTLLDGGRKPQKNSGVQQVVSGAGLIMLPAAVQLFPPFMNFENLTIWVDDHHKRRLHEVAGQLHSGDLECVAHATIQQDRHPNGLFQKDIDWAKIVYFDRLLRGCLLRRLITEVDGGATEYAKLLTDIVRFQTRKYDPAVSHGGLQFMAQELLRLADERYGEVIACWKSAEFEGTVLCDWAETRPPQHRLDSCQRVVDDALRYVHLMLEWHVFTRAITLFQVEGHHWLAEPAL